MCDVVLLTHSPGGETSLISETAAEIRRLRAIKPITAIARTQMASAAFWLAAQATTVLATPSAELGAVGVFMIHVDQSRLNDRIGITPTYITSSAKKIEGNPDMPLADDTRAFLQSRVDRVAATFVTDLALGRRTSEANVRSAYGDGRMFDAAEAARRGMAERVATLESLLTSGSGRGRLSASSQTQADADMLAIVMALTE